MKNEIEELNLLYGVSIYNIMLKYDEFNTVTKSIKKKLFNSINNFFLDLESIKNIDSDNVVQIGLTLLENEDVRSKILKNEMDSSYLEKIILDKKEIKKINNSITNNNKIYIPYIANDSIKKINFYEVVDKYIYDNQLIYSDLIQLLMMNYSFPKKIGAMSSINYCLNFINNINIMFYQLNSLLKGKGHREDIYYCGLLIFNHKYSKDLLFPNAFSNIFRYEYKVKDVKSKIHAALSRTLHFFNKYYYIAIPKYGYDNVGNNMLKYSEMEKEDCLVDFILKDLNLKQIIFLFRIGNQLDAVIKNYPLNKYEIREMEEIVSVLKNNDEIEVVSQSTSDKYKKLIEKNVIGVQEYCNKMNLALNNFIYCPDFTATNARAFVEFSITMNNFEYKFSLRKFNFSFAWNVKLTNNNSYKIKLLLEDDYKHIIQAMIEDSEEITESDNLS